MKRILLIGLTTFLFSCGDQEELNLSSEKTESNSFFHETLTEMEFMSIPAGCFLMGSAETAGKRDEDEYQHEVCVDGFLMGKYEVTIEQWNKIMNISVTIDNDLLSHPIEKLSWDQIQIFISLLNEKTKLVFRLPTEAEWEYAARAGTDTLFHYGNSLNFKQANFDGAFPYPHSEMKLVLINGAINGAKKIGSYEANAFGLFDMHGNVSEFCNDWYSKEYYLNGSKKNPQGPEAGKFKVRRGGNWDSNASALRSANRQWLTPDYLSESRFGFRLVLDDNLITK